MENKKQLGQFFTKNSDYILSGLERFVKGKSVFDPFAGDGDLMLWAKNNGAKSIKGYDIDKKYIDNKDVFLNDSLKNPLKYRFVLTNPPYLNINKANLKTKKEYFANSNFEDLYQISLFSIMNSKEGIVIVPINFLSAENSKKIREIFFEKFKILKMNYFTHQVFPDTTYNVIAFYYKKNGADNRFSIDTMIYPSKKRVKIKLEKKFSWAVAGEVANTINGQKNSLGISRLTEKDIPRDGSIKIIAAYNHIENWKQIAVSKDFLNLVKSNIVFLKAIDSGSENGKISLEDIRKHNVECLISKESSRHMIHLIFNKKIPIKIQEDIITTFNQELNRLRDKYSSLFLTNYRDNGRKRISFNFAYKFINYIYLDKLKKLTI